MDGQSATPLEMRQTSMVIKSSQATDQGVAISIIVASFTAEPPERQRPYPRLHEKDGRQGFMSTERQTE
ncbi:hypothetical protein Sjap_018054 [Stephania japonica]|uniref:Uncharacterized protein n=1 Tax=Stephania japonica TaxID=461633 RepID=A0AAP0I7A3_9MAGN